MPACCAVPSCSEKHGGHKFPRDKDRLIKWLEAIRRVGYEPSPHARVCKKHFTEDDYVLPKESYREKPIPVLKKTAVPSRFVWNENYFQQSTTMKSKKSNKRVRTNSGSFQYECRVCLTASKTKPTDIFVPWSYSGVERTIASHITRLSNEVILEVEKWPRYICTVCLNRLCACLQFVQNVQAAEKTLRERQPNEARENQPNDEVGTEKPWPKPIQLDKSLEMLPMEVEIKQEVISDEELEKGYEDRQDSELMLDIKIEPEEITQQSLPIQVTVNGTISQDQFSSLNGCEDKFEEEYLSPSPSIKEEPMSDDEQTPADVSLECLLCSKTFHTIAGLKAHVITQHSYKSVKRKSENHSSPTSKRPCIAEQKEDRVTKKYVCHICRRYFVTQTDLTVHMTCHKKKFCCYSCNAMYDTFKQLLEHRRWCKVKGTLVKAKTLEDAIRERRENKKNTVATENKKLQCGTCKMIFINLQCLELHIAKKHSIYTIQDVTEYKTKDREVLPMEVEIEKCKEDDRKYSKIETELESIFEFAVEKDNSKRSEVNESVYLDSREQLEKTLGDNGSGKALEVNKKLEEVIETPIEQDSQEGISGGENGTGEPLGVNEKLEEVIEKPVEKDSQKGISEGENSTGDGVNEKFEEIIEKPVEKDSQKGISGGEDGTDGVNERVEEVIEKVTDKDLQDEESQESSEQNVNTGTIKLIKSKIDQPNTDLVCENTPIEATNVAMDTEPSDVPDTGTKLIKSGIDQPNAGIVCENTPIEATNVSMDTDPSDVPDTGTKLIKSGIDQPNAGIVSENIPIATNKAMETEPSDVPVNQNVDNNGKHVKYIEIEVTKMDEIIIGCPKGSSKVDETEMTECLEHTQEAKE